MRVPEAVAILVAGGSGRRLGSTLPKQFLPVLGKPLLAHTLERFRSSGVIRSIVLVLPREGFERYRREMEPHLDGIDDEIEIEVPVEVVPGGGTRQESVAEGLRAVPPGFDGLVAVHDGARPAVPAALIVHVVEAAAADGAAIAAIPVVETLKEVSEDLFIRTTADRARFYRAQTPQCFPCALLRRALERARVEGFQGTDEAALVERLGTPIRVVPGSEENLKVTTPSDLSLVEYYLRQAGGS
jgi:2-C-methyl-D-erythritol 4-phosphate cytidylyltransferase